MGKPSSEEMNNFMLTHDLRAFKLNECIFVRTADYSERMLKRIRAYCTNRSTGGKIFKYKTSAGIMRITRIS